MMFGFLLEDVSITAHRSVHGLSHRIRTTRITLHQSNWMLEQVLVGEQIEACSEDSSSVQMLVSVEGVKAIVVVDMESLCIRCKTGGVDNTAGLGYRTRALTCS